MQSTTNIIHQTLILAIVLVPVLGAFSSPRLAAASSTTDPVPILEGLGSHHLPITTDVPEAQAYFDQGFRLFYAFNFAESIRSFREAVRLDPTCAMCHWGIALALGPNINAPMDPRRGKEAYETIQRALALAGSATVIERMHIEALASRYDADPFADRGPQDEAYASATGDVATKYPDDPDAVVLHAAAVMNLSPWDYWTSAREPKRGIVVAMSRLERVVTRAPDHAGACHFYIHLVESAWPERAESCADRLPSLMPSAGHIVHMPAHVYIRVGRYEDAVEQNQHAVHADETYISEQHPVGEYPLAYYPHNYHFLTFAASMAGQAETAIEASRDVAAHTERSLLQDPDLGGTLQHFITAPVGALVRFGRWQDVLEQPAFDTPLTYPRGHWHFARGMALVEQGDADAAAAELAALRQLADHPNTAAVVIFGINSGTDVLAVAIAALEGRIAAVRGNVEAAVTHLERGIALEDGLTYNEPPDWQLPVRQILGEVLIEADRLDEAEATFTADLEKYPGNRWSTDGLKEVRARMAAR